MSKKHLAFIINPKSGVDRVKAIQQVIDTYLDKEKYSYEIMHTQYAKHGTELAKEASANGAYAVVAVGGDGSVNDIAAGLLDTDTALAIIPKGSGNGLARTLGIPLKEIEAIENINRGNILQIDIGFANGHPFISNAGVAFDALISKKFAKSTRRGFAIYSWLVTKYMWLYNERTFDITIDGKKFQERAFIISVANGKQFGYNFQIAPKADLTDGLFDIVVLRRFPKILGGIIVARAMRGSILGSPYVKHYTGREVTISNPQLKLMQTDGDAHPCINEINFILKPRAQKVIIP